MELLIPMRNGFFLIQNPIKQTNIYWDTKQSDQFGINVKTSIAFEQPIKLFDSMLSMAVERNTRYDKEIRYGLEYKLKQILALRAGYNFNGLNYGCGLYFPLFNFKTNLNYALLNHDMGNCHRIGIALWF